MLLLLSAQSPTVPTPPAATALDDPGASYCLATGFCRGTGERGPAPGMLFLAVGLVSVGVAGLRTRPRN